VSGLDDRQRKVLSRLVVTTRATLFEDAEKSLRGTYGILPDGTIQSEEALAPDRALRARRRTLEAVIAHLRADGTSAAASVERLTREVAFTHLNRLLAIRVADGLGVLAPSLRDGTLSAGFRQWIGDLAPLLATADDTGGYWTYLGQCADELAIDAPALFDPRNPLLALRPSKAAFESVVALLAARENAELWNADDTFGWAYQFFNTREERQEMRKSSAPRDSRELAVRNQFFTPDYVVRFLVHNTLGRRLVEADPSSPLLEWLPLLIDPPTTSGTPVELAHIKVLDPACGSGHFLLGCYDVLEAAWALAGVAPAEAAARIVPCLWGVDIDPRAVQVAQAAVVFRARRACGRSPLSPPNIVCARALPEDAAAWAHAQAGLSEDLRGFVDAMRVALRDAPVLGPLLKAEQRLAGEIRRGAVGADDTDDNLFAAAGIAHDAFGNAERAVLAALQRAADATSATPTERLLAADASDAVRLVEVVRNRYDAVLMNPPFGEPVSSTKDYIKAAYPWIPTKDFNLLAAFVGRGLELCKPEGYVGAITSRAGMFLKTFEAWRKQVMLGNQLVALADLGYGVMEEAMVEAAAYVLSPKRPDGDHAGVYIRLLKDADRPAGLADAIGADRRGGDDHRVFRIASSDFSAIPGSPMAYWMVKSIRRLFTDFPRLEGNGGEVRVGLQTGDDFRFVRLFWEVDPRRIAETREETSRGKRWVPFAKGGEYSPYWSDIHLLLDWERDGERIRSYEGSRPQNIQYFFRPGLTWPRRTASGFGIRALPAGCAFGDKGPALFCDDVPLAMAWLTSRLVSALMASLQPAADETKSGVASKSYEVGQVQDLPWPFGDAAVTGLRDGGRSLTYQAAAADQHDETRRRFASPRVYEGGTIVEIAERSQRIREDEALVRLCTSYDVERLLLEHLAIDDEGRRYLDEEQGAHPQTYPTTSLPDEDLAARYLAEPMDRVIDEIVKTYGGSRSIVTLTYVADRRLEVLAHAFSRHPSVLVALRRKRGILPPDEPAGTAASLISWLVGLAFGRWDARGPQAAGDFDPFAPVPLCPPGMLVTDDGFPATSEPLGYPFALPPDGILLDQPGHMLDFPSAVDISARAVLVQGDKLLADAVGVLNRPTLRDYLARAFFKEHLSRYSESRRQAPVYWQLTIPSGAWSAWLYAPRFSREMLYALVTFADHRLANAAERIRSPQDDAIGSARERAKAIDEERTLAVELQELRDDVARLAGLGWQPDLDDGFVLCAAPLAKWFPRNAWRQLSEELSAIKSGAYPWATVHKFREVL
jgi:SAM-dependent methyltransferase